MTERELQTEACLLSRLEASEKSRGYVLLSPGHGLLRVFQRQGRNRKGEAPLDLFDELWVSLTRGEGANTWFLREHRVLRRRVGIGAGGYENLTAACRICETAARNGTDAELSPDLPTLVSRSLDALEGARGLPEVVYLKFLYSYVRDEGYPVRAHWHAAMSPSRQAQADGLLFSPVAQLQESAERESHRSVARDLTERLESFVREHTDIQLPLR